jgi:AbrB family looped-hinge helix DNA binding protein
MNALTITTKGQITLKKDLLKHLGLQPGDRVAVEKLPDGRIEIHAMQPSGKISDVFGMLKREGRKPMSIEEMNEIIGKGWAGEL